MRRSSRGFTLIELLVVIAIIAILAAMLFPVFARARESARKIQCLANVKNIATAIQMYLVDYDRFPPCELNPAAKEYFAGEPGGGTQGDCCNRAPQANPFLRWQVVLDEYTRNRDVWRCPSSTNWVGATFIVPDYGGYMNYLHATEGDWGRADSGCDSCGPCGLAFPPGWGGTVTDSMAQDMIGSEDTGAVETTIGLTLNYNVKTSQIQDPSWFVVCADSTRHSNVLGVDGIMYSLCRITECGDGTHDCCSADWENCPDTQTCGLDVEARDDWFGDASFRARYTRHLGGANVGFADGHASWFNADAFAVLAPYCECCSDETGYSGNTIHTKDRPVRGLCPVGAG